MQNQTHNTSSKRPSLLLFDVNETLLDLSEMQQAVNKAFKNELAFKLWFAQLLQYSLVETVTEHYHTFSEIGKAALQMTAKAIGQPLTEEKTEELITMVSNTKPHPDVEPSLKKLQEAGFRMATLTNSPPKKGTPHLEEVGLSSYFEAMLSVESVKKFKPHQSPYQFAAKELGVALEDVMMVAAHGWDMTGAIRAGARTAFIARPGQTLYPLSPAPELAAPTLSDLADKLIRMQ